MVLTAIVTAFVDFASNTVVLLISGCVSLVAVSGVLAGATFVFYKHLKYFWSDKSSASESTSVHSVSDESLTCEQKSTELSSPSTENSTNLSIPERASWFLTSDDSGKTKTLSSLQEYLKIKVASTIPVPKYDKDGEIREFLEHLVGTLLSENLDDVPLTPLSQDEQYTAIFSKYHSKLASILITLSDSLHSTKDSESLDDAVKPSTLYNQLKSVIKEVQEEAALLPSFQDYDSDFGPSSIGSRLEGQSYEEILSTAVLNKIISRSQNGNSSFSPKTDASTGVPNEAEHRSTSNGWSSSPKEQLSLTVEEHIEEITTSYQLCEEEPDSLTECSTTSFNLIGRHRAHFPELGKDVVDATNTSSATKTNYMYKYDFKSSLEIPTFKNDVDESEGFSPDHDQDSSGVTSISRDFSDAYSFSSMSPCRSDEESLPWTGIREAKNESILLGQVDSGEGSLETQPESEYLHNGDEVNHSTAEEPTACETFNFHSTAKLSENSDESSPSHEEDLATPPKPGTIAEREHRKWEYAAPIPNNPYSKENIEKRSLHNLLPRNCVNSTSNDSIEYREPEYKIGNGELRADIKKYERDYYVNTDNKKNKTEESSNTERRTRSVSREEHPSQNGFSKTASSSSDESPEKPKPNLVRVSSWSDRKKPDIEIRKRLPSVKELAKQFSAQTSPVEIRKVPVVKNQMVHSLTARSMSKEFREGLKNNIGKTFNRNVHTNGKNDTDKLEECSSDDVVTIQKTVENAMIF